MPDIPQSGLRHATAFISKSALRHNALLAATIACDDNSSSDITSRKILRCEQKAKMLCMIKANAYGHGLIETARVLKDTCWGFGVARINEGIALREDGINNPVVVMSDYALQSDIDALKKYRLTPTLYCENQAASVAKQYTDNDIDYWVKIDTGMRRLGITSALQEIINNASVIATHLHSAGAIEITATEKQLVLFSKSIDSVLENVDSQGERPCISFANSAALLQQQTCTAYSSWKLSCLGNAAKTNEIIRPGIMLYGADPLKQANQTSAQLKPAMTLAAPIIDIRKVNNGETVGYDAKWIAKRPSHIATAAIGYGDGYPRHAPSGTPIKINGQIARLAGSVSMDMIGVDITDLVEQGTAVNIGDTAILWGNDLAIEIIAGSAETISYDLLTGVSSRVERIYQK